MFGFFGKWKRRPGAAVGALPATKDDIFFCYRLLLGRNPDAEGFKNYSWAIKTGNVAVDELAQMFLSSAEFKNRNPDAGGDDAAVLVDLPGFRIYVSPGDWSVGKYILDLKIHEPHVTALMRRVLKPGMVFVDIGANIGYFTLLARSVVGPTGRVYAFEPSARNCALLHLSLGANSFDDVELFPFALADAARLYVYDAQASNGIIMRFEGNPGSLSNRTLIRSVALDQTLQPKRCDVLKIDVEGAEGLALKGGIHTIRNHRPVIFSEFSPPNLERVSGMSGEGYLAFLFSEGYSVSVIEPSSALAGCGQDVGKVMDCFKRSGGGHIDLLATQAYPAQYH